MKLGHLIRAERIKQKMKQVVLARGICTPSYLSKIERNLITPSEEVVTLLFNKLDIDVNMLQENDPQNEAKFEKTLTYFYKEVITKRDNKFTEQCLLKLESQNYLFENQSLYYSYLLITLRFRLILGKNFEARKKELEELEKMSEHFNPMQLYWHKVNNVLYYYATKNQKRAIEYLEGILTIIDTITVEDWEKAEVNYIVGTIYTSDNRIFNSIDHIRKALEYFRDHLLMKRVLDCYVLIGITQKRSEQFQEALDSYLRAKQICDELNFNNEKGIIYHNLGTLYGTMGNSGEAIYYLKNALKYKKEKYSRFITMISLVVEYSKMKNNKLVNSLCNEGLSLLFELNDEKLTSYYYHFSFYKSLYSENGLSVAVAEQSINHFEKLQDYQHVHKYSIAFADWYYQNRKYKLASIYYQKANRYGYIYRKIEKWEDL